MTKYKRGDIVLIDFGFSEGKGPKKRPTLIISSDYYHKNRQEVIIAAITGNIRRELFGDTRIDKWEVAGLICPSVVTGIIRTVKNNMIINKLGTLLQQDFNKVQKNLEKAMGF